MSTSIDSRSNTENLPTHGEIEKRAYDLYLQSGEVFTATEYWLIAEEELKKSALDTKLPKQKTASAVAGRVV